jgi:hypothetical protein
MASLQVICLSMRLSVSAEIELHFLLADPPSMSLDEYFSQSIQNANTKEDSNRNYRTSLLQTKY